MHNLLSKRWEKRAKGDKGFTLIELLVVVVILGVLIAIAIPLYLNYRKGANDASAQSDMRNAINVLEQCNSDNGAYPTGSLDLASAPPCTNQKVNVSNGTLMNYASTAGASYVIVDWNSNGSNKVYCYDSANAGPVKAIAAAPPVTASAGSSPSC